MIRSLTRAGQVVVLVVLGVVGLGFDAWAACAIRFSNLPGGETLRTILAWAFFLAWPVALVFLPRRGRSLVAFAAAWVAVLVWWLLIPASHDRDWEPEYARLPTIEIDGDVVTVRNVRDLDWTGATSFRPRYAERVHRLSELETVEFAVSHWDGILEFGHTMLSFGFAGGDHLVVSFETRRERGEPQTALRGLFKQYEQAFLLGTESDLFRVRTDFRDEALYLYPTTSPPADVRTLFRDLAARANRISEHPAFYNSLTDNCTTALTPSVRKIRPPRPFDWRLLKNGYTDEMALENGWIDSELPIDEARRRFRLPAGDGSADGYSVRIRSAR